MASRQISNGLAELLRSLRARGGADASDGQLLRNFLVKRDEEAFAAIVGRHGAMVLGVCRRILGNAADAEDAFQATFLVLFRKAAALTGRTGIGDWLHGVARFTALHVQRRSAGRQARELALAEAALARPAAHGEPTRDDWLPLLDEELSRLRTKYRLPIVLCDLEGKSRREAAAALGWPEGTVAGRLARGRALLAKRLARRGALLSVGSLTAALVQPAGSAVSAALADSTIRAACFVAAGTFAHSAVNSGRIMGIVEGTVQTMFLTKLKAIAAAAALMVLAAAAVAYGVFADRPRADQREPAQRHLRAAEEPNIPPSDPKAAPDAKKDDAGKPARLVIALDKQSYEVGEPIALTVRLTNSGSAPLDVPTTSDARGQYDTTFLFVVKNAKGKVLKHPGRGLFGAMSMLGGHQTVAPGNFYAREFLLNYHFSPLPPGEYAVHAVFQPGANANQRDLRTQSQSATFRIAVTPIADVQRRVAGLTKELRDGGEYCRLAPLLGFTGHVDAVTPLLGLFYAEPESMDAIHALLHFDRALVKKALLESIQARGPRYRMMDFLLRPLQTKSEELIAALIPWLDDKDGEARFAAVDGLALANRDQAPELFSHLEKRLKDPLAKVRHRAASAVGAYHNAAALQALKTVVRDPDAGVSEQATIAVGWVAKAAAADSALRKEAVVVLREMSSTASRAGEQAKYWLRQVEEK